MNTIFKNQVSRIIAINQLCNSLQVVRFDKGSCAFDNKKRDSSDILSDQEIVELLQGTKSHPNPQGDAKLIRYIQDIELRVNRRTISNDQISITNGALSGIYSTLSVLCKRGDSILVNDLCFEGITSLIKSLNLRTVSADFQDNIDLEMMIKNSMPRVIIVNSPENPSGKIYPDEFYSQLNFLANKYSLSVMCDEVNNENIFTPYSYISPSNFIAKKRLITVNSFTKNYFLPGIRIGWVIGERSFIQKLTNSIVVSQVGVNNPGQVLARLLVDRNWKGIQKERKVLQRKKEFAEKMLEREKFDYKKPVMGGTVIFLFTGVDSKKLFKSLIDTYKIGVIPGFVFGNKWKKWIRIGFAALSESAIEDGIVKIKNAIEDIK